ncbi:MAG: M20/M25/M40 family metallo-hydrolase [Clostridia bacterium]|nr:M20/M25/M40 family metallo-hydrolase [Clostridia bacterium]
MTNLYTTLQKLCACPSVSGREERIREMLREMIAPFCDEVSVDNLGNLIAKKKGAKADGTKIMLCAHMDEIGFLVTFIEKNGLLRVAPIGGIKSVSAAFTEVISERGVAGVLVPNTKTKPEDLSTDKLYIDLGVKDQKSAERKVSVGDFFVLRGGVRRLAGRRICGRPIDDRIGCAVLLSVAERLSRTSLDGDVYYVFSAQEEVGGRGALPAAFAIRPDVSLCVDVTGTGDTPGADAMACSLGEGVAVKIKDSSLICHEEVVFELCRLAEENKIPYQREILLHGGTDASQMQLAGSGSRAGALSIPCRYIHSAVELCELGDAEACVALAEQFVLSIK